MQKKDRMHRSGLHQQSENHLEKKSAWEYFLRNDGAGPHGEPRHYEDRSFRLSCVAEARLFLILDPITIPANTAPKIVRTITRYSMIYPRETLD